MTSIRLKKVRRAIFADQRLLTSFRPQHLVEKVSDLFSSLLKRIFASLATYAFKTELEWKIPMAKRGRGAKRMGVTNGLVMS